MLLALFPTKDPKSDAMLIEVAGSLVDGTGRYIGITNFAAYLSFIQNILPAFKARATGL